MDLDLATARASLQTAINECATSPGGGPGSTTTTSVPPATTSTSTPAPTTPTTQPNSGPSAACVAAQQQALRDEQTVAGAQQALADAEVALNRFLAAATPNGTGNGGTGNGGSTTGGGATNSSRGSSAATATAGPSAEQLVAYQAAVDAAAANVAVAVQALAQATIVSPITGTVVSVNLTAGHHVSAGATTDNVVVVGNRGYEVSTTVSVAELSKFSVGDPATITPDGTHRALAGKVVSIGVGASSSGSTALYPVVIGFSQPPPALRNGASASVQVQVAKSKRSALAVPTSAVRTTAGLHFVTVLAAGKTSQVRVTIGAVGPDRTEVTSGLQAGQVVVLADLHAALPASNTNTGRFGATGLGGTLTGGGGFVVGR